MELNKIYLGDAFEILKTFPSNCVDAVVTDPPYGLEFMSQKWDREVPPVRFWKEVLRVMKPGAHLLSFFGTRTYHRGVVNIEDAGFEIRDMIQWLYGSGFSKGMDISKAIDKELGAYDKRKIIGLRKYADGTMGHFSKAFVYGEVSDDSVKYDTEPATPEAKEWQGWNTSLKPACEPIVLARKPLSEKNVAQNVLKWGVGGLNIDGCRVGTDIVKTHGGGGVCGSTLNWSKTNRVPQNTIHQGRYPTNVILDEEAAKILDRQSGIVKRNNKVYSGYENRFDNAIFSFGNGAKDRIRVFADSGGASRFFYCAKAGRNERFAYCRTCDEVIPQKEWDKHKGHELIFHTTVKPLKLMEYLVRLVTPPNGVVLDPFLGTGTTAVAALKQGFKFVGIEINEYYYKIAEFRVNQIKNKPTLYNVFK